MKKRPNIRQNEPDFFVLSKPLSSDDERLISDAIEKAKKVKNETAFNPVKPLVFVS